MHIPLPKRNSNTNSRSNRPTLMQVTQEIKRLLNKLIHQQLVIRITTSHRIKHRRTTIIQTSSRTQKPYALLRPHRLRIRTVIPHSQTTKVLTHTIHIPHRIHPMRNRSKRALRISKRISKLLVIPLTQLKRHRQQTLLPTNPHRPTSNRHRSVIKSARPSPSLNR